MATLLLDAKTAAENAATNGHDRVPSRTATALRAG